MAEQLSGAELDAKFFEVCWPGQVHVDRTGLRQLSKPPVSTDATACEAWAMRWARENRLLWRTEQHPDAGGGAMCFLTAIRDEELPEIVSSVIGTDWKEAFVRACVAAGQILKQAKGGA